MCIFVSSDKILRLNFKRFSFDFYTVWIFTVLMGWGFSYRKGSDSEKGIDSKKRSKREKVSDSKKGSKREKGSDSEKWAIAKQ